MWVFPSKFRTGTILMGGGDGAADRADGADGADKADGDVHPNLTMQNIPPFYVIF